MEYKLTSGARVPPEELVLCHDIVSAILLQKPCAIPIFMDESLMLVNRSRWLIFYIRSQPILY